MFAYLSFATAAPCQVCRVFGGVRFGGFNALVLLAVSVVVDELYLWTRYPKLSLVGRQVPLLMAVLPTFREFAPLHPIAPHIIVDVAKCVHPQNG